LNKQESFLGKSAFMAKQFDRVERKPMKTKPEDELRFEVLSAMDRRDWRKIEDIASADLRHKTSAEPIDYLTHWCNVARIFAYATRDYSWGELEKEFPILIKQVAKWRVLSDLVRQYLSCEPTEEVERWCELSQQMAELVEFNDKLEHPELEMKHPQLGATGHFPEGKYAVNDEGELSFAVAADKANGKVLINFGKPVQALGMSADDAIRLAELLTVKAGKLR
jgi:hypothetical protein